jgi:hypothetical protein
MKSPSSAETSEPLPRHPPSGRADGWLLWPTISAMAVATGLMFGCGLPGVVSLVFIPLTVLGFILSGIVLLVVALLLVIRGKPRRASSFVAAVLMPALLWHQINWIADCLHLGVTVEFGRGVAGPYKASSDESQFKVFDWSVGLAGGPSRFLIHDTTDEIATPLAQHKHPVADGIEEVCAAKVTHLLGHYFVCTVG